MSHPRAALAHRGIGAGTVQPHDHLAGTAFTATMNGLTEGARKNAKAFEEHGVQVFDSSGAMRSMSDIVEDMEGALGGMSVEQQRAALSAMGFNRQALNGVQALRKRLDLPARSFADERVDGPLPLEQFLDEVPAEALTPIARTAPDQSNTSVVFGRRLIMKLFRRVEPGPNPDVEIGRFLLDRGFGHATQVDASQAYLAVATAEAERRGHGGRVTVTYGDFHAVAPATPMADVVTLDRVVCCDPDYSGLLGAAADHARHLLAFTFPRARWYTRAVVAIQNAWRALVGDPFRAYVHPPGAMAAVLESRGMRRRWAGGTWVWQAELFERGA